MSKYYSVVKQQYIFFQLIPHLFFHNLFWPPKYSCIVLHGLILIMEKMMLITGCNYGSVLVLCTLCYKHKNMVTETERDSSMRLTPRKVVVVIAHNYAVE